MSMLEISHISFGYSPDREVLQDLCLRVPRGSIAAVLGPNGAGARHGSARGTTGPGQ